MFTRLRAGAIVLLLTATVGCGSDTLSNQQRPAAAQDYPACPEEGVAEDRIVYSSVKQMADLSVSAVEATVTDKGEGARSGEDTFMEYTIETEAVLAGADMPETWRLRTGYILPSGCEMSFNGLGVLEIGDRAVLFVQPASEAEAGLVYSTMGTQGRFKLSGDDVADSRRTDALTRRVEAGSAAQLRADTRSSTRGRR